MSNVYKNIFALMSRKSEKLEAVKNEATTIPLEEIVLKQEIVNPIETEGDKNIEPIVESIVEPIIVEQGVIERFSDMKISAAPPIPQWYRCSLQILQGWRVKGDTHINIAKKVQPQDLTKVYSMLADMLASIPDTEMFIRLAPKVLFYEGNYLNSYIGKLSQILGSTQARFGYNVPKEFDWKRSPSSFSTLEGLAKLESMLSNFGRDALETEILKLREALEVYAGKNVLLLGIRTKHQEDTIRRYLPTSTRLTFHSGEDIKGLANQDFANYDVFVFTGGVATHKINQKLQSEYGEYFNRKVMYSFSVTNPQRIIKIMAENASRF